MKTTTKTTEFLDPWKSFKVKLINVFLLFREIERQEKKDLQQYANNLQATLGLANIKINQSNKLGTAKHLDYKNVVGEKLELKSK